VASCTTFASPRFSGFREVFVESAERLRAVFCCHRFRSTGSRERGPENVTLRVKGDKGTQYSGTCTTADKEEEIGGQVPQSFEYELEGEQLECEITKRSGTLKIVLIGDGTRAVQQVGSQGGTFNLAYNGNGGVSFSTTSSSGSSTRQVVSSSSSA